MATSVRPHAFFDPESDYSRFRAEFDRAEHLYGYFDGLIVPDTGLRHGPTAAAEPGCPDVLAVRRSRVTEESFVTSRVQHKTGSALEALATGSAGEFLSPPNELPFDDNRVRVATLTKGHYQQEGDSFSVSVNWPEAKGLACQVKLLTTQLLKRIEDLTQPVQEDKSQPGFLAAFSDTLMRKHRELNRVLAATPELAGDFDGNGVCSLQCAIPPDSPIMPIRNLVVMVVNAFSLSSS